MAPKKSAADRCKAHWAACFLAVQNILNDVSRQVSGRCKPHVQAPVKSTSAAGQAIPQPLPDRRPLPAGAFDDQEALLQEEAATHYWYITNVINLFVLAPCQEANFNSTSSPSFKVPDGWSLLHMENYPPQGKQRVAIPAYAVLKSADGSQMAVIVRGTRTAAEWRADLSYAQVTDPSYPGLVSKGFLTSANALWPALQQLVQREVLQGGVSSVTIAGHSLGAAMATMLSYRAQVYLDQQLPAAGKPPLAVGALLFAAPNVGNNAFVAAFNSKVNARRIAYVYDLIPQVPCAPRMMACPGNMFETTKRGVSSWNYGKVGGQITFTPDAMPVQPEVWAKTDTANPCMMFPWAVATHVCSYTCFYSKFAAAGATADGRCKLWAVPGEQKAGPSSDYCIWYPYQNPEYPLRGKGSVLVIGSKPQDSSKPLEIIFNAPGLTGRK